MSTLPNERYSAVIRALHWSIALLVIAGWYIGVTLDDIPKEQRLVPAMTHFTIGVTILVLALARVYWQVRHRESLPGEPGLAGIARTWVHRGLVALILALPVTGLFMPWSRGRDVLLLGGWKIPAPFLVSNATDWHAVHAVLGNALLLLVLGHAATALYHHFVRHDGVLRRMLPGRS